AEASGKLSGRPGIAAVTRGPGATNASAGLHIAEHDATPMILLVGQIGRGMRGRGAFQELDIVRFFSGIAKWSVEIDAAGRVPELLSRAFHVAMSGRPGPVVLGLPEDLLAEPLAEQAFRRVEVAEPAPSVEHIDRLVETLCAARAPLLLLGGSRWDQMAVAAAQRFAHDWDLPVACSFRRQMLFDHLHPNYAGDLGFGVNPRLATRIRESDLLLLVGGRLAEVPSQGYDLLEIPTADEKLVHVHPDPAELGRVYQPILAINATPGAFLQGVNGRAAPERAPWSEHTRQAHADYLQWSQPAAAADGGIRLEAVFDWLERQLPGDAILTNGAGNYSAWLHRFHRFRAFGTQLAPVSGSMGYGLPAAIAAALAQPGCPVLCFAGDGCFQMTGQEFATAVQYRLPLIVLLIDNGMYGTIRMHQERRYPGRVIASDLQNPDFVALARAYGGYGEWVERSGDFPAAFRRAQASGLPALLHLPVDPELLTPTVSLAQLSAAAASGGQSAG
ncbi:MAG: thiamine pyrophosphate-binding protein, partial [Gammaproteobacteria bacterium]|nr:thiamine pyrophosphate-binding protein [Gammaproteobacteria bacterium]